LAREERQVDEGRVVQVLSHEHASVVGVHLGAVLGSGLCNGDEVAAARQTSRRLTATVGLLLAVASAGAAGGLAAPAGSAGAATAQPKSSGTSPSNSLVPPKTTFAQDAKFFTDVTELDPALATYEQKQGNLALRALLTDGSAFCALLRRGGGIDKALVAEAEGARSTEAQTKLPMSVTTFNTIEAVALLTLCPSEQKLVPASVRSKIRRLGATLAHRTR
jgi:hypothetical protein